MSRSSQDSFKNRDYIVIVYYICINFDQLITIVIFILYFYISNFSYFRITLNYVKFVERARNYGQRKTVVFRPTSMSVRFRKILFSRDFLNQGLVSFNRSALTSSTAGVPAEDRVEYFMLLFKGTVPRN